MSNIDTTKLFDALSKRIDELSKTVEQLSKRVDNLEGLDYTFWLPTGIAFLAVLITIYQTHLSNKSNKKTQEDAILANAANDLEIKNNRLANIQSNIDAARINLQSISATIAQNVNVNSSEETKANFNSVFNSAIEGLINKYEDGCYKYFKNQIPQEEFKEIYHQAIKDIVKQNLDKFDGITPFTYTLKYYKENHIHI